MPYGGCADISKVLLCPSALGERTKLQLACPEGFRRVLHEAFREVACRIR